MQKNIYACTESSVADSGSGAFLTLDPDPGSGIGFFLKTGPNCFLQHLKNKIIFNFVKFVAKKKGLTTNFFFTPLFCCCFWIRDPE
jgi:hypothetical protein